MKQFDSMSLLLLIMQLWHAAENQLELYHVVATANQRHVSSQTSHSQVSRTASMEIKTPNIIGKRSSNYDQELEQNNSFKNKKSLPGNFYIV